MPAAKVENKKERASKEAKTPETGMPGRAVTLTDEEVCFLTSSAASVASSNDGCPEPPPGSQRTISSAESFDGKKKRTKRKGVARTKSAPISKGTKPPTSPKKMSAAVARSSCTATVPSPRSPPKTSVSRSASDSSPRHAATNQQATTKGKNMTPSEEKKMAAPGSFNGQKRAQVKQALHEQETKGTAKSKDGASGKKTQTTSSSSEKSAATSRQPATAATRRASDSDTVISAPPLQQGTHLLQPGAYIVQGQNVSRAVSGILSPHNPNEVAPPSPCTPSVSGSGRSKSKKKHRRAASNPDLVIAAELAPDPNDDIIAPVSVHSTYMEAEIEREVQRRIQAQTSAQAQVVAVNHDMPLLDPDEEARRIKELKEKHKPRGVREKLFGDSRSGKVDIASSPDSIRKRNYLKWTIKRNPASNQWVASVQTDQRAIEKGNIIEIERTTESFAATTQQEAFETGLANAVPIMQPFEEYPICHVCKTKFAVFRRAQHCHNCGVCVCSDCSIIWPSKMFPETYGQKKQASVCRACDWLASSFQDALVNGNYKQALYFYATGNVNLRTLYNTGKKNEAMYPVHLAVLGANVKLLRWLTSERFCPLSIPVKQKRGPPVETPVLTSNDRSPLAIALLYQKLHVVHFLVVEKNVSLFAEKDSSTPLSLANFTTLLKMLPQNFFDGKKIKPTVVPSNTDRFNSSRNLDGRGASKSKRRPSM